MSLKTRLDGRSDQNSVLYVHDKDGNVVSTLKLLSASSVSLEIDTEIGMYVSKSTGWSSRKK